MDIEFKKFDITGPLSPTDWWTCLISQMLSALEYLADRNMVHEDVKPANILFKLDGNGHIEFRLADFSNSGRSWVQAKLDDNYYRPLFRPPEWTNLVREGKGGTQPSADVWALAMTMVWVAKKPPHATTLSPGVWDKVQRGLFTEAVETVWQQSIDEYRKLGLLWPMLRLDPDERYTAHRMTGIIRHVMDAPAQSVATPTYRPASLRGSPQMIGSREMVESPMMIESPEADNSAPNVEMDSPPVIEKEEPDVVEMEVDEEGVQADGSAAEAEMESPTSDHSVSNGP